MKQIFLPLISAFFLVSCTQLPDQISFAEPVESAKIQEIYLTSGRLPSTQDVDLQKDRSPTARFVKYDVSIPSTHQIGQIEWPKGLAVPKTDFAVTDLNDFETKEAFIDAIKREPGDEVTVFVHGYNNTPSEALYRFAQIGHDFEISMPRFLFSWPSAGKVAGYVFDRDSVLFSRDPFADLLTQISRGTEKKITLMAHSMGAHLAMEAMRQLALTDRRDVLADLRVVVLLAPDIDPDIFRVQAEVIGELPDPFVIMTSKTDRALKFSAILNIGRQKVGDLIRAADIEGFKITLFDFTELADGSNLDHLVPMTSPTAIAVLRRLVRSDRRGQLDLSNFDIGADGVIRARASVVINENGDSSGR